MYENNDTNESDLQMAERRRLLEIVSKKGLSFLKVWTGRTKWIIRNKRL